MIGTSVQRRALTDEVSPIAETQRTVLREAITRYNNELLDDEERMLLQDRIRRLRKKLGL